MTMCMVGCMVVYENKYTYSLYLNLELYGIFLWTNKFVDIIIESKNLKFLIINFSSLFSINYTISIQFYLVFIYIILVFCLVFITKYYI